MGTPDIIIIALGMAMDAAAVCLAAAAAGFAADKRAVFRLAFHFGLFQFLMPVLGWFMGMGFANYVQAYNHWVAFALLLFVGGRMVVSGMDNSSEDFKKDPSKGLTMVMLSMAVSIDALAIGISFAMIKMDIWYPGVVIGVVTSGICLLAIGLGKYMGTLFGKRMEVFGGLVLIGIGTRILLSGLLA